MAFPQPEIKLGFSANQMIRGSHEAQRAFEGIRSSGDKAFTNIQSRAGQAGAAMMRLSTTSKQVALDIKGIGLSLVGLGTTMIGIVTSLSNLDRAAARVQKTLIAVRRVEDQMASTQLRLNVLFKQGKANTEQYGVQVDRLSTAQADLIVKNLDVKLAQDALNDTQILFATVVANTAINSLFLMKSAFAGVTLAQVKNTIVSKLMITTHGRLAIGLRTTGTAAIFTAAGIRAATIASIRFMATPFGAVLTAIGIGFLALQTNAFGLADALQKLTGINARVIDQYEEFDESMKSNDERLAAFKKGVKSTTTALNPGLTGATGAATGSLASFTGGVSSAIGSSGGTGPGGGGTGLVALNAQLSEATQNFVNMREEAGSALARLEKPLKDQLIIESDFRRKFQEIVFQKNAEERKKETDAFNQAILDDRARTKEKLTQFTLIENITTAEERNNELIATVLLNEAKKELLLKRLINLKKVHGNFEEAINAIVGETAETMLLQKELGGQINAEELKRLTFLRNNLENQVRILNIQKEQTKELKEQKKSLLDSFELLLGSKPGSPLFGLSGVFRNQRNREGGATSTSAREIIGFQSGEGSTITVGGQTFRSRILNPKVILGGLADAAIALATIQRVLENFGGAAASRLRGALGFSTGARGGTGVSPFIAAFGAGNAADFSNAISRGLVRAIQNPFGTRNFDTATKGRFEANTFSFISAGQEAGFRGIRAVPGDTSPGPSVTPAFITMRAKAAISFRLSAAGTAAAMFNGQALSRSQASQLKNNRGKVLAALGALQRQFGRASIFSPLTELLPFIDVTAQAARNASSSRRRGPRVHSANFLAQPEISRIRRARMKNANNPLLLAGFKFDPLGNRDEFEFAVDLVFNFGAFMLDKAIPAQIDQVIKNFSIRAAVERGFTQDREQLLKGVSGIKHFRNFEDELQLTQKEQIEILFTRKGHLRENFFREFDDILSFWNKERFGTVGTEAI